VYNISSFVSPSGSRIVNLLHKSEYRQEGTDMARIVVLGAGMMGTAVTIPLADNGHDVQLVGTHLDSDIIEEIHESRTHPKLHSPIPESIVPYTCVQLDEAMQGADLVILGVNSLGVQWAADMLGPLLGEDVPIVAVTKGLAGDGRTLRILLDVLRDGLPRRYREKVKMAAIGGPSIAGELAARRHTCIILTGRDQTLLDMVAGLLRTPYYHIWTSTDVIGVEVCVAMKNLYSLGVGLVQGLLEAEGTVNDGDAMHNLAAAIFAQGLSEISYLVRFMGGGLESVYTLPGAGDLYVTCQGGRNSRMGRLLGLGKRYSEAKSKDMPDDTVEGAELALAIGPTIEALIDRGEIDGAALPLLLAVIDIVCRDAPAQIPWDNFFCTLVD
jgi:glycerol-3-phosphate dehydrogenase (NAD(P)+)